MILKSSTGAIKTVRNIDDLRAIGETTKLTYKTIAMENKDTDFQFYDRLLTRTSDKILQGIEGRSVRHLHIDFLTRQINKLYTEWAKLFKSEKYLNTPIDHFYRVNEATLNFKPTEWLDLYNHTDAKTIPVQKGTERPDRSAVRDDDRAPRNGKRDYPDRDARNRHDADRNKKPRRDASPPKHRKPDDRQPRRAPPPPRQTPTSPGTRRIRRYLHSQPIPPRGSGRLQTPLHSQALPARSQPAAPQRETRGSRQEGGTCKPTTHGR